MIEKRFIKFAHQCRLHRSLRSSRLEPSNLSVISRCLSSKPYSDHKSDRFVNRHIGVREKEVQEMLGTLGYKVSSIEHITIVPSDSERFTDHRRINRKNCANLDTSQTRFDHRL